MLEGTKNPITVVLDNVRSAYNVGAVFRCCDAFGVRELLLCGITAYPPHRKVQKTALGATETVPWRYETSTVDVLRAQTKGERIAVETGSEGEPLQHLVLKSSEPLLLVFGHEVEGISKEVQALCTKRLYIPQLGEKTSLNLSVAVGIVLWKLAELSKLK